VIKTVDPAGAKELIDTQGFVYLDVRSISEYEQGHAPGAVNAPLLHSGPGGMVPNPEFVRVVEANYTHDTPLVLGCKAGSRSMRAAQLLEAAGFTNLVNMDGGFHGRFDAMGNLLQSGWTHAGLPETTDPAAGVSWQQLVAKAGC
jgi:rhodanese-related sulfurtransferase